MSPSAVEQDSMGREVPRRHRMAAHYLLHPGHMGPAGLQHPAPGGGGGGRTPRMTGETAAVPLGHKQIADFTPEESLKIPPTIGVQIKNPDLAIAGKNFNARPKYSLNVQEHPQIL